MDRFYCDNLVIRDNSGRQRIFRGINICCKESDISPHKFRKEHNIKKLKNKLLKDGVNLIRFGVTWASIEPEEKRYNAELIAEYVHFVKECEKLGIYVILDMHQDLFTEGPRSGDGAPKWALNKEIKLKREFLIWAEGYFYMDGVQQAFYDFWKNKNGIQDKFIETWKYYAACFKECSNIIGMDWLNEPYVHKNGRIIFTELISNIFNIAFGVKYNFLSCFQAVNDKAGFIGMALKMLRVVKSPRNMKRLLETMDNKENFDKAVNGLEKYTADFNKNYYEPFIEKLCKNAILKDTASLFEHNYFSNLGIPFQIDFRENSIYSPHAYDIFVDSPLYNKYASNGRVTSILEHIRENQLNMNVPVIMGEWGGGATGSHWVRHIDYIMNILEEYQWSSIYWNYDAERAKLKGTFDRPYPVAICGNIKKIKTDTKNRSFELVWEQDKAFENSNVKNLIFITGKGITELEGKTGLNEIKIEY